MRRVRRPKVPDSLRSTKAEAERERARAFYAQWDGKQKYDDYKVYKSPDVRAALEEAFGHKCAYCETFYGSSQPVAIEHYRPKGEVTIDGKRVPPGYYWLASEWENLLPSCTDCNSPRKQDLPTGLRTAGKSNAFPLASERTRATSPEAVRKERRLLLHPYLDHPERHLEFVWGTDSIDDGWVRPKASPSGRESAKGRATIEVCALQRRGLVKARRERLIHLLAALRAVEDAQGNVLRHPDDPQLLTQLADRLDDVEKYRKEHAPYSLMARQVVAAHYRRLFGKEDPS